MLLNKKNMLTGTVCVVHKVHLERVSIVENALGVGGVITQLESLQRGVIYSLIWDNVDRRLPGPIGYRILISPFVRSYKYIFK